MAKITTPRLLLILAVLVGVFVITRFTGNKGRSKSLKTELVAVDTAKVSRIEIMDPQGTTILEKIEGQWMVGEAKAVTTKVRSMLSTLNSIEPTRIASRSESKWQEFSVDSTGTRVKVYEGSKLTGDIVLGRFGVEGQRSFYTYVRQGEEDDTYLAANFMKMSINTKGEDFRNNEVLKLKKDSLNTITFNYPDSAVVLTKDVDQWYVDNQPADSTNTVQYLNGLGFVTSKKFVNVTNLGTPELNVTFGFSNRPEIQVSAFRKPQGWVIQSTENPDEVWVDNTIYDKIFVPSRKF